MQLDSIVKPQTTKEINLKINLKLNLNERKQTEMKYNGNSVYLKKGKPQTAPLQSRSNFGRSYSDDFFASRSSGPIVDSFSPLCPPGQAPPWTRNQ